VRVRLSEYAGTLTPGPKGTQTARRKSGADGNVGTLVTYVSLLYTVSGKNGPPKENAVKCTVYNIIQ